MCKLMKSGFLVRVYIHEKAVILFEEKNTHAHPSHDLSIYGHSYTSGMKIMLDLGIH